MDCKYMTEWCRDHVHCATCEHYVEPKGIITNRKTNGDKIRSMRDEKLAEYLATLNGGGSVRYEKFLKWLKEEAKE